MKQGRGVVSDWESLKCDLCTRAEGGSHVDLWGEEYSRQRKGQV